MQNKRQYSIDGFVSAKQRQLPSRGLEKSSIRQNQTKTSSGQNRDELANYSKRTSQLKDRAKQSVNLQHDDLSIEINNYLNSRQAKKMARTNKLKHGKFWSWRRIVKIVLLVAFLAALFLAGRLVLKAIKAAGSAINGNWTGLLAADPLKTDKNGRTNILIFGTAEDDMGGNHEGANLTDSIMLLSYHQENKDLTMINLPRDLWVKLDKTCSVGNQEKINTVYMCGSDDGKDELAGAEALKKKVAEITGLDIHYHIHINFSAVVSLVDAVGGVEVEVMGGGPVPYGVKPGSILDRNMDWRCNYQCYLVKYEPGKHFMDGEHALAFMRARNSDGGYGLPRSNFDREQNQQRVVKALISKMLDGGTLTNYGKVVKIVETIGDNLRTNISTNEVRSVAEAAKNMINGDMRSLSLIDNEQEGNLVKSGSWLGRSVVMPTAGIFDYQKIQAFIKKQLLNSGLDQEAARIGVFNATEVSGLAQQIADQLSENGLTVAQVGNAKLPKASNSNAKIMIYPLAKSKPKTLAKINQLLMAKQSESESAPEFTYDRTLDILVIILGQ